METVFILKLDLEDWNNLLEKYSLSSQELWMTLRSFWKKQKYVDIYSDAELHKYFWSQLIKYISLPIFYDSFANILLKPHFSAPPSIFFATCVIRTDGKHSAM